jgi:hypothetical protein
MSLSYIDISFAKLEGERPATLFGTRECATVFQQIAIDGVLAVDEAAIKSENVPGTSAWALSSRARKP